MVIESGVNERKRDFLPRGAPDAAGREGLDYIAKDHVSHSDRHAEDSG